MVGVIWADLTQTTHYAHVAVFDAGCNNWGCYFHIPGNSYTFWYTGLIAGEVISFDADAYNHASNVVIESGYIQE